MKKLLFFTLFISMIGSCKQNEFKVDVSDIDVDIEIKRLDADLANANIDSIELTENYLKNKYKNFYQLYFNPVLNLGNPDLPNFTELFKLFLTDYSVFSSLNEVSNVYPSVEFLENELTNAFKHYKYYFPEKIIPEIITIITGFNQSLILDENIIAIALDKYLGRNSEIYGRIGISNYLRQNMHKNMITSDVMKAWAITEFPYNDSIDNLISNMVYNGKIHYFQRCMLPDVNDTIIMGYNINELKWCEKFEKQMWEYLIDKKLFFETGQLLINKFTKESPFTKDFGGSSPGRSANWLGWQIVKSYMKRNPEITLKELMENDDYMEILSKAKYKP